MTETEKHKELLSIYKDLTTYPIWEYYNYYYLGMKFIKLTEQIEIKNEFFFFRLMLDLIGLIFLPQQYELFDNKYLNNFVNETK